jgi:regulator of replication initiation timing
MTAIEQFEKNVQASFGYVKKDLLMLNDSVSDIQEKIQHLGLNHATLLSELETLRFELEKIKGLKAKKSVPKITKKVVKKTKRK